MTSLHRFLENRLNPMLKLGT